MHAVVSSAAYILGAGGRLSTRSSKRCPSIQLIFRTVIRWRPTLKTGGASPHALGSDHARCRPAGDRNQCDPVIAQGPSLGSLTGLT